MQLMDGEVCRVVMHDRLGEPRVYLRRFPESAVEVLTVDEAHALADEYMDMPLDDERYNAADDEWLDHLTDLLEGIR